MSDKPWTEMTPREKRVQRFKWWLDAEEVNFIDGEAKEVYRHRVQRFIDVYNVEQPDRVPVSLPVGSTPAYLYGNDYHSCMYDYDLAVKSWDKFNEEFKDVDSLSSPAMIPAGKI